MVCPVSFNLNGECELHSLKTEVSIVPPLATEVSIVPPLLADYHLSLSPSHTDDTEYSDKAGLCFKLSVNNSPLLGHLSLSAVGVVTA